MDSSDSENRDSDSDHKLSDTDSDYLPKKNPNNADKKIANKRKNTSVKKNAPKTKKIKLGTVAKKAKISKQGPSTSKTQNKLKIKNDVKTEVVSDNKIKNETVVKEISQGWHEYRLLAEKENLDDKISLQVVKLLEEGNTIPFIARYRKHLTNDMSPEQLRDVKTTYEELCSLKLKISNVLKTLKKADQLTSELENSVLNCKNFAELEHIYAPFKQGSKKTLAERAKSLGLENPALSLLTGSSFVNINALVQSNGSEGLKNLEDVEKGLMHIIAHNISIDSDVLDMTRKFHMFLKIASKLSSTGKKADDKEALNFKQYFDYEIPVKYVKPHQILAMNRGENLKILSIKIVIPDFIFGELKNFCEAKWLNNKSVTNNIRIRLIRESINDAYKRLISPLISRHTRSELKTMAEKASVDSFTVNLKKLLLGTPLKGQIIMGIDPGLKVGCKIAVVSPTGDVLDTGVIYPHTRNNQEDINIMKTLITRHNCSLIALGNGKACRETEAWLTNLIQRKIFSSLDVKYTIVDERGASVYSCSPEAKKEFPKLNALVISAISLARRVQDPLAELVKVDPKNLGVGMYQHDLNQKVLETALGEVVTECVSFVGVDLNTASQLLLTRVAGLTSKRAESILAYRTKNGRFTNRQHLKDVKGIGEKVFEQCAGFLRVGPHNSTEAKEFYERPETMPLDCTWIHPESYDLAEKIIWKFHLNYKQIGQPEFIKYFTAASTKHSVESLAREFKNSVPTVQFIIDVLSRPLDHDLRIENPQEPLFKKEITTIDDLSINMVVTGKVENVVDFGAFVDIGVGRNGLIHRSAMNGINLELGDRVQVKVLNIDKKTFRIGLQAVSKF